MEWYMLYLQVEGRASIILAILSLLTAIIWITAAMAWKKQISLLVVAYTLGLRHALDADHIAAIDNVTRKLLQVSE